eukprot:gb/GEZN01012078.1/.p1 GENE.gb/GEZN01012078.1/~~gb/GEZN01012078.1/.p1  ORF type:complete len:268 (+),score=25.23 gb/GEZN01012078.1/:220-1023(+)
MVSSGLLSPSIKQWLEQSILHPSTEAITALVVAFVVFSLQFLISSPLVPFGKEDTYQLRRKAQHTSSGLAIGVGMQVLPRDVVIVTLFSGCLFVLAAHWTRLRSPTFRAWVSKTMGPLMRPHEQTQLPGAFYFLLGNFVSSLLYPQRLYILSLLAATVVDPVASFVGKKYGTTRLSNGKAVVGAVGGCVAGIVTCCLWHLTWEPLEGIAAWPWDLWVATGLCASFLEVVPCETRIDDNFIIPVGTGALLTLWLCVRQKFSEQLRNYF